MPRLDRNIYGPYISPEGVLGTVQRITKVLDGQISFGKTNQNGTAQIADHADIQIWKATGTTPAIANTEFAIPHNLTWVPWFYYYILDKAGVLYQLPATGTAWTAATPAALGNIFVKCSVVSANFVVIII